MSITLNGKVYNFAQFDQNGTSRFINSSSDTPSGFSPLTARVSGPTAKAMKVKWRLAIPTVATEASSCSCPGAVLSTDYVTIECDLASNGSATSRADVLARITSLVGSTQFGASITTLVQPTA